MNQHREAIIYSLVAAMAIIFENIPVNFTLTMLLLAACWYMYATPYIVPSKKYKTKQRFTKWTKLIASTFLLCVTLIFYSKMMHKLQNVVLFFKKNIIYPKTPYGYHLPLVIYCFFLFILIFFVLTSFKTSLMAKNKDYHFYYGLIQIIIIVVLVTAVLAGVSYVIYIFSSRFLSGKDTLDLIKWSIGALSLGLNAFNIKLFVDYFRGAKVNAPYSLEQLQQLQILQQMQENIEDTDEPEKKLSQEKIMNQEDIKSQIKNVKDSGNL